MVSAGILLCLVSVGFAAQNQIDFVDADLFLVLEILSRQAGLNLVAGDEVRSKANPKTTLHFKDISYREALLKVLAANGLDYEIDGQAIILSLTPAGEDSKAFGRTTTVVDLIHLEGERVAALIKTLYPKIKCGEGAASNEIILEGRPSEIREVSSFIAQIDLPQPQVLIESQVVEVSSSGMLALGLQFGSSSGMLSYVIEPGSDELQQAENFSLSLSALQSRGEANVLATPKIVTLDGRTAEINIGKKVPYAVPAQSGNAAMYWRVEYLDAGVKLKITPRVLDAGCLLVEIEPEVSAVAEWRVTAAGEFPVISTRNVKTKVRVKDGETILIGGLLSDTARENVYKVPFLGDLPLLGFIFQQKKTQDEKSEIIFMITPKLVNNLPSS
jgi:type II secretory pathway component GspD/PulD (secretin)